MDVSETRPDTESTGKKNGSEGLYLGDSDLATRPSKFLSDPHWERLEELRARYDPDGLFLPYLIASGVPLNVNPWTQGT